MIHHLTAEMGARYIAPQYYVVVKMPDEPGDIPNRFELYDWYTLDEGRVLLAFSFQEWCGDFVKTYYTGEGWNPPRPHNQDALSLAEVLEYLEPQGTWMVAFDPMAVAPGKWMRPRKVVTARYWRRFAKEVRPPLERLFAEKATEVEEEYLGYLDDYLWKIKELCAPSVPEIVRYAHTRASEWELDHC